MSDTTLDGSYVVICDWHGHVIWLSTDTAKLTVNDYAWQYVVEEQQELCKTAFSRVVTLKETIVSDIENTKGDSFRCWLWPLNTPEMAVCILSMIMPKELKSLSKRERETLNLLAKGYATKEIAAKLDVSLSTVQTHLKRSREKTGSRNQESLAAFAARYCLTPERPATRGVY